MTKKYLSPDDIQDMRNKGYDPATLVEAEQLLPRWHEWEQLRQKIYLAFANVTLEDGIGLYQAQGLDDYASEAECLVYREKDEKLNWQNIQIDDLNRCSSSLSFFDAKGMRFHLPAFMIAELNGDYLCDLVFTLTYGLQKESYQDYQQERYRLFNVAQRMAVADYLQFLLDEPDYIYHHQEIMSALIKGYWSNTIEY